MTQIILLMILMTGSVAGCVFGKNKFEEFLPITSSGIVLILFLSGILGFLNLGVYLIIALAAVTYIASAFVVLRNKKWKHFFKNLVTPGFFVFVALYFLLSILIRDMMVCEWDEFSHWADIVKVMVTINDFGTNPEAGSLFASYTPGTALFQYFFQKIYLLMKPSSSFSEWRLYFAYQIFFVSYLIPFFKGISFREPLKIILLGILVWLAPILIFTNVYSSIYVDAILGFLTGAAFATVFVKKEKGWLYDSYIYLTIAMLVLTKDAGMLFAAFLMILYIVDLFYRNEHNVKKFIKQKENVIKTLISITALMIPKLLWSWNIKINEASVSFGNKIDFPELVRIVLGMEPDNYRSGVLRNYSLAFLSHKFEIGNQLIEIPYAAMLIIFAGIAYWIYTKYKSEDRENIFVRKTALWLMIVLSVVFVAGTCVSYMYKFSEHEALQLAGFGRYIKIIFQCWYVFILLLIIHYVIKNRNSKMRVEVVCFCFIMSILPWTTIAMNVTGQTVDNSFAHRAPYQVLINQIEQVTKDDEKPSDITVICQETKGYEQLLFRYALRPHEVDWKYSIGEPFYEGDGYTEEITAEEWQERLVSKRDYVALYKINDYFVTNFSSVFENPEEIMENGLYKVNKKTGLLELCSIP